MIVPYTEDNQEQTIDHDKDHLTTLAYTYKILKLMPYPKVQHISFCVNPKAIDKKKLENLQQACIDFDSVVATMYNNLPHLINFYKDYASGDAFMELLLRLYHRIAEQGFNRKKPVIYINRHDFMFDKEWETFVEIEYNLIAASMGFHSHNLNKMLNQYYTLNRGKKLPFVESNYLEFHKSSFVKFWSSYHNPEAYIGIVLSDQEGNIFETIQFEELMLSAGIKTLRIHSKEILNDNFWLDDSGNLIFKGKEIGIVYYRYMYDPSHFVHDSEDFVLKAELSNALCLPSVETLLINMKLNQFLLANESVQAKYNIPSIDLKSYASHMCPHFILRDNFDNDKEKMIEEASKDLNSYLLKTFKEGGYGDIIGGQDIINLIKSESVEHLNTYMLVRKVKAPTYPSYVWFEGSLKHFEETISEFGIYTSAVIQLDGKGEWKLDWQRGTEYLLRTKPISTLKGGVAVNAAFIDSLINQ